MPSSEPGQPQKNSLAENKKAPPESAWRGFFCIAALLSGHIF
jgi:hypothetical protein